MLGFRLVLDAGNAYPQRLGGGASRAGDATPGAGADHVTGLADSPMPAGGRRCVEKRSRVRACAYPPVRSLGGGGGGGEDPLDDGLGPFRSPFEKDALLLCAPLGYAFPVSAHRWDMHFPYPRAVGDVHCPYQCSIGAA